MNEQGVYSGDDTGGAPQEVWQSPRSPKSRDDVLSMSPQETVDFLNEWTARTDWCSPLHIMGRSPAGLGDALREAVTSDPKHFDTRLEPFSETDPTYVRSVIDGLRFAIREGRQFEWESVLAFCLSICRKDRNIPNRVSNPMVIDPDWGWARHAVAHLIQEGIQAGSKHPIPFALHSLVWEILGILSDDPDPAGEEEGDPIQHAPNTVRGEAIDAVVLYALWCHRDITQREGLENWRGFESIPDVRAVLEEHLNPVKDPSLAVRTLYGRWFPWLDMLDHNWAKENVGKIFPLEEGSGDYWKAAWEAYLFFTGDVYRRPTELLESQIEAAIDWLSTDLPERETREEAKRKFASHIMIQYLRGWLGDDPRRGLMGSFWEKAPAGVRAAAISYIGVNMLNVQTEISEEISGRLKSLLEFRIEMLSDNPGDAAVELPDYGFWFESGWLPDDWSLDRLIQVLELTGGRIEDTGGVLKRLSELATSYPVAVMKALLMVGDEYISNKEMWVFYPHARDAFREVMRSGNEEAIRLARPVKGILMVHGLLQS